MGEGYAKLKAGQFNRCSSTIDDSGNSIVVIADRKAGDKYQLTIKDWGQATETLIEEQAIN